MARKAISVLLVDDHEVVRAGLRSFLDALEGFEVVGEAESGTAAVDLAEVHVPDVVLMDLLMPGMDGVEATRRIREVSPRTQVVVLTSFHDDQHIFPALKAGAISYLLKDVTMDELAEALRQATCGEATLNPRVAARVVEELRGARQRPNLFIELTEREMETLRLIADGSSNAKIAETLFISQHTVKGHVSNILSKLHLVDRTEAAVFAWREGLVRRDT